MNHNCSLYKHTFVLIVLLNYGCASTGVEAPVTSAEAGFGKTTASTYNKKNSNTALRGQNKGYHIVVKGETLYSIAWRYAQDFKDIARWNQINPPYVIYPEQVLRLKPSLVSNTISSSSTTNTANKKPSTAASTHKRTKVTAKKQARRLPAGKVKWHWPTRGKLLKLNLPTMQKGVNITGKAGQDIKAAAVGDVVYSGSGLLGYGKLIIIKHNESYLSAYAHNNEILVKEGTRVMSGQKIATMGINDGKPILHFEIRRDGKPVDPLNHLPKRL